MAVSLMTASVAVAVIPGSAFAGTGTGGGSGGCTDSGQTVDCGSGVDGQPGSSGGTGGDATPVSDGGGSTAPQCPDYVPYSVAVPGGGDGGPPPAGAPQPGAWYVNLCAQGGVQGMATGVEWFATGAVPNVPPPDPAVVGAEAASELRLSSPSLVLSPSNSGYVNLAEWLWIDPSIWHSLCTTAQACNAGGCTAATATATPAYVTWNTGDGSTLTCSGPGTVYNTALPADAQSSDLHPHLYADLGGPAQPRRQPQRCRLPDHRHGHVDRRLGGSRRFGRRASQPDHRGHVLPRGRPDRIRERLRTGGPMAHHGPHPSHPRVPRRDNEPRSGLRLITGNHQRRPWQIGLGIALVLVCAAVAGALFQSSAKRVIVVVATKTLAAGTVLTPATSARRRSRLRATSPPCRRRGHRPSSASSSTAPSMPARSWSARCSRARPSSASGEQVVGMLLKGDQMPVGCPGGRRHRPGRRRPPARSGLDHRRNHRLDAGPLEPPSIAVGPPPPNQTQYVGVGLARESRARMPTSHLLCRRRSARPGPGRARGTK